MSGGHYTAMVKCNAEVLPRPALNGNGAELSRSYSYDRNPPPSAPVESTERPDAAWMCFDDDVVTAIPAQALEATIVSGMKLYLSMTVMIYSMELLHRLLASLPFPFYPIP